MNTLEILDEKVKVFFDTEKVQELLDAFLVAAKLCEYKVQHFSYTPGYDIRVHIYKEHETIDLVYLSIRTRDNQTYIAAQLCLSDVLETNSADELSNFLEKAIKSI